MVVDGLFGSPLSPKNTATLLTWVHYRGLLVLVLMAAGNLFCMGCPFILVRDLARRFVRPTRTWPRWLRNKWPAIALLVAVLYFYELLDLWGNPAWTAILILLYFGGAVGVDIVFRHATFCKFLCPVGQFNFVASTLSPLEVKVRSPSICASCTSLECIKGAPATPERAARRGCELALFQPMKVGNLDCTFCMDCVGACPEGNVGLSLRLPTSELFGDPLRSGIGRVARRDDFAALALVFLFGALLNAFGMVSPVYVVEGWVAGVLGTRQEWPVLAVIFAAVLVVEPALLLGATAWWSRRWSGVGGGLLPLARRQIWGLVPLGFGLWVSHYSFHLLTGLWTFIPVLQRHLMLLGWPLLGSPDWSLAGLSKESALPIELGLLTLGYMASMGLIWRLAEEGSPKRPAAFFVPWGALCTLLLGASIWLLLQPMEMRATFLGR